MLVFDIIIVIGTAMLENEIQDHLEFCDLNTWPESCASGCWNADNDSSNQSHKWKQPEFYEIFEEFGYLISQLLIVWKLI